MEERNTTKIIFNDGEMKKYKFSAMTFGLEFPYIKKEDYFSNINTNIYITMNIR